LWWLQGEAEYFEAEYKEERVVKENTEDLVLSS
jgi:hypothetical protein